MKEMSPEERVLKYVPRVCIFGGKAFATYVQAKRIVKFITDVGAIINHDAEIGDLLKVRLDLYIKTVLANTGYLFAIYKSFQLSWMMKETKLVLMSFTLSHSKKALKCHYVRHCH